MGKGVRYNNNGFDIVDSESPVRLTQRGKGKLIIPLDANTNSRRLFYQPRLTPIPKKMGQRTNASAANSKPINPEDPATSLCAAPVKVAGEFFVVVGAEVGMLDGTTASVVTEPVGAGPFAVVAVVVLVLAPELNSAA